MSLVELLEKANQEKAALLKEYEERQIKIKRSQEEVVSTISSVFDALKRANVASGSHSIGGGTAQIELYNVPIKLSTKFIYEAIEKNPDLNVHEFVVDYIHKAYRKAIGLTAEA